MPGVQWVLVANVIVVVVVLVLALVRLYRGPRSERRWYLAIALLAPAVVGLYLVSLYFVSHQVHH